VILVLSTDGIGDFILRVSFLQALERSFPGYTIYHIVRKEMVGLASLFRNPCQTIPLDHEKYRYDYLYRWKFLLTVPRARHQFLIYPVYSRSSVGDEIASVFPADRKITFSGDDLCMSEPLRRHNLNIYTDIIECDPWLAEKEKYRLLCEQLGVKVDGIDEGVEVEIDASLEESGLSRQRASGINPSQSYAVIFPTSSNPLKNWTQQKFALCCSRVESLLGLKVVLCGSAKDRLYLEEIARHAEYPVTVICNFSLPHTAVLIKHATLIISVDSGTSHLAIALNRPTVVLVGGGQFGRHYPVRGAKVACVYEELECFFCNWRCPFPEPYCMTKLSVEDVVRAAENLVNVEQRA
jgi:ADP-heptose:LPS heptosyltransferase